MAITMGPDNLSRQGCSKTIFLTFRHKVINYFYVIADFRSFLRTYTSYNYFKSALVSI